MNASKSNQQKHPNVSKINIYVPFSIIISFGMLPQFGLFLPIDLPFQQKKEFKDEKMTAKTEKNVQQHSTVSFQSILIDINFSPPHILLDTSFILWIEDMTSKTKVIHK